MDYETVLAVNSGRLHLISILDGELLWQTHIANVDLEVDDAYFEYPVGLAVGGPRLGIAIDNRVWVVDRRTGVQLTPPFDAGCRIDELFFSEGD